MICYSMLCQVQCLACVGQFKLEKPQPVQLLLLPTPPLNANSHHFSGFPAKSKTVSMPKASVIWQHKGIAERMAWDAVIKGTNGVNGHLRGQTSNDVKSHDNLLCHLFNSKKI